ncbi:exodeoxyribonuclease V subunit gamma [Candidatus Similichlamydia epinepheli]|uniref:exodeoxyribonuclease V subunit gamma n=1 Tax=Candidatus Similichlamydia epinepheli TaxID=1903953 RepID=UPI001300843A|nr:exodeoxyribonuclease V subunit gamma [Candidatus Similichlamydia epinepheli]
MLLIHLGRFYWLLRRSDEHRWIDSKSFLEYEPSSIGLDRYAFLESICAAQDKLVLFYSHSKECQSLEESHASSVLEEFLTFLDKDGIDVRLLPCNDSVHRLHSLSERDMDCQHRDGGAGWLELVKLSSTLSLVDMRSFLRNPSAFFLQKILLDKNIKQSDSLNICSSNFFASKRIKEHDIKCAHDWIHATWPRSFASFEERIMLNQVRHEEYQVICSDALHVPEKLDGSKYLFPSIEIGNYRITGSFSYELKIDSNGIVIPDEVLESVRTLLPWLPEMLAFRMLPTCFGFEGKIRTESDRELLFSLDEAESLLKKLFLLCLQGSTCLMPWNFFSRLKKNHIWNLSLPANTPIWLIRNLEESITPNQREELFRVGWEDLVTPFEEEIKSFFSKSIEWKM